MGRGEVINMTLGCLGSGWESDRIEDGKFVYDISFSSVDWGDGLSNKWAR